MKQLIGISRDHSASMNHLAGPAMKDYNDTIQLLKEVSAAEELPTALCTVQCGNGRNATVLVENTHIDINQCSQLSRYDTQACGTPLFDSVDKLITLFENSEEINDPEASFLIIAVTDGEENASRITGQALMKKIAQLQATDRWTFVFRVPKGYKKSLVRFGIPDGNIFEWELTAKGMEQSSEITRQAVRGFYQERGQGVRSTQTFYTNLKDVSIDEIKDSLVEITNDVNIWRVDNEQDGSNIRSFCEKRSNKAYIKGAAHYLLTKRERAVQDYKSIVIRDKKTFSVYAGRAARDLLGLPSYGTIKLAPEDHGQYEIFIQSTSINRKLPVDSLLLYWPNYQTN